MYKYLKTKYSIVAIAETTTGNPKSVPVSRCPLKRSSRPRLRWSQMEPIQSWYEWALHFHESCWNRALLALLKELFYSEVFRLVLV